MISQQQQLESTNKELSILLSHLQNKPFYIWNKVEHEAEWIRTDGACCFNHSIPAQMPRKNNEPRPLYDYQRTVVDTLLNESDNVKPWQRKHLAWLKSRGIGGSELILRLMAWLATKDDKLSGSEMAIITGNRQELADSLVTRMKELFSTPYNNIRFDSKQSVFFLNNVKIIGYPALHSEAIRGTAVLSFAMLDEASFWPTSEQQKVIAAVEGMIQKSQPYIICLSTVNQYGDLMDKIFNQSPDETIYQRLKMDWTYSRGKLYSDLDISNARKSQSWNAEMELKLSYGFGNCFSEDAINACITDNYSTDPDRSILDATVISVGVDIAYGSSSKFAVCATAIINGKVQVLDAHQYERLSFQDSVDIVFKLITQKYHYYGSRNNIRIFVDASSPEFCRDLLGMMGQTTNFESTLDYARKNKIPIGDLMYVVPVPFSTEGRIMLNNLQSLISDNDIMIHPKFSDLILQLRIAKVSNTTGNLEKSDTTNSTWDLIDALRLSCSNIQRSRR